MIGSSCTQWAARVIRREKASVAWHEAGGDRRWLAELGGCFVTSAVALGAVIAVQHAVCIGLGQ